MTESPARHLSDAADAVRAFNHTSRSTGADWKFPSDAYTAVGNLSYLAGMLGQAIEQSTVPVTHTYEQGRIRIDGKGLGAADAAVDELEAAREDAVAAAVALTAAVQRMHNATSPMGLDTTGLPEFDED